MKRMILLVLMIVVGLSGYVFGEGLLIKDANRNAIQGFAPDGNRGQNLTNASTTVDMSRWSAFRIYNPTSSTCKRRHQASATAASELQRTVPVASTESFVVNPATPFTNLSSCNGAEIEGM